MHPYVPILRTYMAALGRSDYATIKSQFARGGRVQSPLLGLMDAGEFFDRLAEASSKNVITPIDIFLSASDTRHATAYFHYDWTIRDGTVLSFKAMDLFTFARGSTKFEHLDVIYDTHPIRQGAVAHHEG